MQSALISTYKETFAGDQPVRKAYITMFTFAVFELSFVSNPFIYLVFSDLYRHEMLVSIRCVASPNAPVMQISTAFT